ncbi:hypothetical protein C0J52_07499, partial [Blattella germanica]
GCNVSDKVNFLHFQLNHFLDNLGDFSDKFYKISQNMQILYQEKWNVNMVSGYCWMIKGDSALDTLRIKL